MINIKTHFKQSLASRLMLVFAISGGAIVILILVVIISGFASQWKANVRPHLEQYLDYINDDIGNPPNIEQAKKLAQRLPVNIYISSPAINFSSTGQPLDLAEIEFEHRERNWGNKKHSYLPKWRKQGQQISFGENDERMIMRNKFDDYSVYFELLHDGKKAQSHRVGTWALCTLLIIFVLSFWQLRRMLRPVQDIKKGVKHMGSGELDYRVPIRANNDLGELSASINQMAGQITQMLDAKRQLLLAASHELRSPLTRAKIAVQMLEPSTNATRIEEDLLEMEHLITDILEAERINGNHAVLNKIPLQIESLLVSVIEQLPENPLPVNNVQFLQNANKKLPLIALDEQRIRLLLRNLLNNAICHGAQGVQPPSVATFINEGMLVIEVKDHGTGMTAEELLHITEPFYRADSSRTRDTGGFGIGLYLCKLIVEAHKGELVFESELNVGTCVTVRLPVDEGSEKLRAMSRN